MIRAVILLFLTISCQAQDWNTLGAAWSEPVTSSAAWYTPWIGDAWGIWPMAEGSGTNVFDVSGNSRTAYLYGSPTWNENYGGVDGWSATKYMLLPNYDFSNTSNHTFSVLLRVITQDNDQGVVGTWTGTKGAFVQYRFSLLAGATGILHLATVNRYNYQTNSLPTSVWVHVCCVFDGTKSTASERLKTYVNGFAYPCYPGGAGDALQAHPADTYPAMRVGHIAGLTSRYTHGQIQRVMFFSRSLSSNEVVSLYSNSFQGITP